MAIPFDGLRKEPVHKGKSLEMTMSQLGFYFDSSSCSGCKTCLMACRDKNNLESGLLWRRVYELVGGNWMKQGSCWVPELIVYNLSLSCNHCEEPLCLLGCPSGAIGKRADGVVLIDRSRCLGCRYCEWNCPYGAPRYDPKNGRMGKCDFCVDLIDQGEKPACVNACPMRALDFGPVEELKEKYGDRASVFPMPGPELTRPALIIKPHPSAARVRPGQVTVSNREEV